MPKVSPRPAAKKPAGVDAKKQAGVDTLFGEDLISEKSLDEVILSYLSGEGDQ
jgi:hypothetical protein